MRDSYDVAIVGAGPNGLAAAIVLAAAGLSVVVSEAASEPGGGSRSDELTLPGFVHDVCAGFHPLGVASPLFRSLPLEKHGLEWRYPDVQLAHPLDSGSAGLLRGSVLETSEAMGDTGYARMMAPLVSSWDRWIGDVLRPPIHRPEHLFAYLRFAALASLPTTVLAKGLLSTSEARALFAGMAAHAIAPLGRPVVPTGTALTFAAVGHALGWPVAKGGSGKVTEALVSCLRYLGGQVRTDSPVASIADLRARVVLADVTPLQLTILADGDLSATERRRLRRFKYGPGSFKVDYALSGPMPWTAEECRRAGMVHVGGTLEEVAKAEALVQRGIAPDKPFILVGQQSLVDPTRAPQGKHTLWTYCHVPSSSAVDMLNRVETQLDRFAPGFRDLVIARAISAPADLEARNKNYVGGDIASGAATLRQVVGRPFLSATPYRVHRGSLYLCSSSTSPGPGVHGMCGYWAAVSVLRDLGVIPRSRPMTHVSRAIADGLQRAQ